MPDTTYYETLGIDRTASPDEIKRAFRKKARKYHPDIDQSPHAEARFKEVGEAYEVLRDPTKRAGYDRFGKDWEARQATDDAFGGGYDFETHQAAAPTDEDFRTFFENAFGQRATPEFAGTTDAHVRVRLTLEEALRGGTKQVSLRLPTVDHQGNLTFDARTVTVPIPKGILPGQHIRLSGQGGSGLGRAGRGDLFVEVAFEPHPTYRLEGRDIHLDLPITPWEAALGGKIAMPSPAGRVEVTIPKNARTGQKLRLKGRGWPGAIKGDLYARLILTNPPDVTPEMKELFEKLSREAAFDPRARMKEV